jgi:uncharacterized membrane protein
MLGRFILHFFASYWQVRQQFPSATQQAITQAIVSAEAKHAGEMRFVIEAALTPLQLLQRVTPRQRALDVFSHLRIWDTEHNNGVLIYVLLGDHAIEIIADRGIQQRVQEQNAWPPVIESLQQAFAASQYQAGAVAAVDAVAQHLRSHFPRKGNDQNELPDEVRML